VLIPYGVDNPMGRLPWMNWALIAANVAVYFGERLGIVATIPLDVYGTVPADLHWYQPLTSAFLHAGPFHLFGNMLFLWTFGNNVNDRMGHLRYLGAYLAFAYLSDLAHALLATGNMADVPCIGASGAVYGVIGTYLTFYPINDVKVFFFLVFVTGTFRCSAFWIIGFYVAWDLWDALAGSYGAVAVMAHLAGFGVGAGLGMLLLSRDWVERDEYDLLSRLRGRRGPSLAEQFARKQGVQPAAVSEADAEKLAAADRMRAALQTQIEAGDFAAASELYGAFLKAFPGEALNETPHIALANWLLRAGRQSEAAAAFHHFARTHPQHAQAAHALYSAGVLYGQKLGQPARGQALLEEAATRLRDPAKARRARDMADALDAQGAANSVRSSGI